MPSLTSVARLRSVTVAIATLICSALVGSFASPAHAAEPAPGENPLVGAFGIGDDLEATISERDGAFELGFDVGGLGLKWDSLAAADDRHGIGPGWRWGFGGGIHTAGGVEVRRASGGSYPIDPTHPTGLAGYGVLDTRFDHAPGVLDARPSVDGPGAATVGVVGYEYVLHELGGEVSYFDERGEPVAQVTATGQRTEWRWDDRVPHRLLGVVDSDGVELELDWEHEPGAVLLRPGSNLPPEAAGDGQEPIAPVWRLEVDGGRVVSVTDPTGGVTSIDYDAGSGLISQVAGRSNAVTEVAWRAADDGIPRVETVRTRDALGHELSRRSWAAIGDGTVSSGWPVYAGERDVFWSNDPSFRYSTELHDGATRVRSAYNSLHELISRHVVVTTASGEATLREQHFTYPGTEEGGVPDPAGLPGNWSRPIRSEMTYRDRQGGARTTTETFEFDERGRVVARTAADGTRTDTMYDDVRPEGAPLPIGLETEQTVTAADGLVERTVRTLNDARTAVLAVEVSHGRLGAPLTLAAAAEYDVAPDGFIREERTYPTGEPGPPVRTVWTRTVDLAAGHVTTTETRGAGTVEAAHSVTVASLRHGGALEETGAAGTTVTSWFDGLGRVTEQLDAVGNVVRTEYETAQSDGRNAATVTAPDGVERTETRDELGRITLLSDNIDRDAPRAGFVRVAERREYPEPGIVRVTDAWGATTTAAQDVFGRAVRVEGPTGLVEISEYDDVANQVSTGRTPTGALSDAEQIATQTLDAAGRPVQDGGHRQDGTPVPVTAYTLDGFGRPVATTDGTVEMHTEFDAAGNPSTSTLAAVGPSALVATITAEQHFDGFGSQTAKVLGDESQSRSGVVRRFDALGRAIEEIDQLDRLTSIAYTADGLVSRIEHGSGQLTEIAYDPDSRAVTRMTRSGLGMEPVVTAYRYDPATARLIAQFDPSDPASTELEYAYDPFGNVTRVTYPDGAQIIHEYDAHGRRLATVDVALDRTEYTYDAAGLPLRVEQSDADRNPRAAVTYRHDAYGRIVTLTQDNGVVTELDYTSAGEIASETTTAHGAPQSKRDYEYDARGNLIERIDRLFGDAEGSSRTLTTYQYDAFDRLVRSVSEEESEADISQRTETSYELTPSGDVKTETTTHRAGAADESRTERTFEYSPLGELRASSIVDLLPGTDSDRAVTQRYDEAGNLIDDGEGTTFEYNAANRLIRQAVAGGAVTRTDYWADGTRRAIERTSGDGDDAETTTFYWDGATLRNEVRATATGSEYVTYLLGAARHARTVISDTGASTSYLGSDRHRNITELTGPDGAVTAHYSYTDYGARTIRASTDGAAEANPFGYAGEYTNEDGTQSLGDRIYDSGTMRFTSMDTADLHNTYAYADLNPVTAIDPSGRDAVADSHDHWATIGIALASFFLSLASMVFAPPAGIVQAVTLGFMIGDVFAMAVGATGLTLPGGLSEETRETVHKVELGLIAVALVGAAFAIGRFLWGGLQRAQAQMTRKWQTTKSTMGPWSPGGGKRLESMLLEYIADIDKGAAHFTSTRAPEHVSDFVQRLRDFVWRSPSMDETRVTNVASKTFWVQFWHWMDDASPSGMPKEVVLLIAKWFYGGADELVPLVERVRGLTKTLANNYNMKLAPGHAWGRTFADVRFLGPDTQRATKALPLYYPPDPKSQLAGAVSNRKSSFWSDLLK